MRSRLFDKNLLASGLYALAVWLCVSACQYGSGEARLLLVDARPVAALALLLFFGRWCWVGIGAVALISNLLLQFASAAPTLANVFEGVIAAGLATAGQTAGPWLAATIIERWTDWRASLEDMGVLARFTLIGVLMLTVLIATTQTLAGMARGTPIDQAWQAMLRHASAIMVGALLLWPALMVVARSSAAHSIVRGRTLEAAIILLLLLAAGVLFTLIPTADFPLGLRLAIVATLIALWGAIRISPGFVAAVVFGAGVWAVVATVAGRGPLAAPASDTALYRLLEIVLASAPAPLLIAVAYAARTAQFREADAALDLLAAAGDEHGLALLEADHRGQVIAMNRTAEMSLGVAGETSRGTLASAMFPPAIGDLVRGYVTKSEDHDGTDAWSDLGEFSGRTWRIGRVASEREASPQFVISGALSAGKKTLSPAALSTGERAEAIGLVSAIQSAAVDIRPHLRGVIHGTNSLDRMMDLAESLRETLAFGDAMPPPADPLEDDAEAGSRRRSILLAARGAHVRSILSGALKGDGFDLVVATNTDELADILKRRPGEFSVLIFDTDLADDGDASGLAKRLLRKKSSPKAILLADEQPVSLEADMGERLHVLCKPFALARLRELMREVLASS